MTIGTLIHEFLLDNHTFIWLSFDRLLIAQAIAEDLVIVSVDDVFDRYPVQRFW